MAAPLTIAELERLLTEADPGVVLLSPRLMRRVIRLDCNLPGMGSVSYTHLTLPTILRV